MTPGARIQAVTDILENIEQAWRHDKPLPADYIVREYMKDRRYMGSKDRAFVANMVFWIVRYHAAIIWWCEYTKLPTTSRSMVIVALHLHPDHKLENIHNFFTGGEYTPAPLYDNEEAVLSQLAKAYLDHKHMPEHVRLNIPEWILPYLRESMNTAMVPAVQALSEQANVDLRVNTLKTTRQAVEKQLDKLSYQYVRTPISSEGIRLLRREPIQSTAIYRDGLVEIQDEGSQIVSTIVDARPGMKVVDFCAGSGGKSLSIAADMENKGEILALDTSPERLHNVLPRLARSGVTIIKHRTITHENDSWLHAHAASADRVLVDAPCSGTGTWRRHPDLKWRTSEEAFLQLCTLQKNILVAAAKLVKPGGRLIYATCSLLKQENEYIVEKAVASLPMFKILPLTSIIEEKNLHLNSNNYKEYLSLTPHRDNTDGFFAVILEHAAIYKKAEES